MSIELCENILRRYPSGWEEYCKAKAGIPAIEPNHLVACDIGNPISEKDAPQASGWTTIALPEPVGPVIWEYYRDGRLARLDCFWPSNTVEAMAP